jgi:predicted PurR-regulated permease PerM
VQNYCKIINFGSISLKKNNKMSEKTPNMQPGASRPYTFDRVVRIIITVLTILGIVWLLNLLSSVLLPFLVAWLIAYILEPFVQFNRKLLHVRNRIVPIFLTLFEVVAVIVALCYIFVPSIMEESHQVATVLSQYAKNGTSIPLIPESVHSFLRKSIDFESISRELTHQDWHSIFNALSKVVASGYDLLLGIFSWFIVILYVVFIMLDYERLLRGFKNMVPPKYRKVTFKIANDIKVSMNHYFRGQALVAFCVGILFSIGFLIIKFPLAIVMGMFIGLLNMVPYLQLISIIPTTLLCVICSVNASVSFWGIWGEMMAVYVIVQCIQDLILTPHIMGKSMGLNPAIILLSISIWGYLLGFIGLIVALPLTTLLLSYYNQYITRHEDAVGSSDNPMP